jgi:hypothetical protein
VWFVQEGKRKIMTTTLHNGEEEMLEYFWFDRRIGKYMSKIRLVRLPDTKVDLTSVPQWDFVANGGVRKELIPFALAGSDSSPLRKVLCGVSGEDDGGPSRVELVNLCSSKKVQDVAPWIGLTQEYTLVDAEGEIFDPQTLDHQPHDSKSNQIALEHFALCHTFHLNVRSLRCGKGGVWSYSLEPLEPLRAVDELHVTLFLLQEVAAKYGLGVDLSPSKIAISTIPTRLEASAADPTKRRAITTLHSQLSGTESSYSKLLGCEFAGCVFVETRSTDGVHLGFVRDLRGANLRTKTHAVIAAIVNTVAQ